MKFVPIHLPGAWLIELDRHEDDRGFFARTWCEQEFATRGIPMRIVQCNISFNRRKGTLRGLHYQAPPHAEAKVVRCTRGRIYDVLVDLRPGSGTLHQWAAFELTPDNDRLLYIPEGVAHGLQTLEDNTEVFYLMGAEFHPESARGLRWNDPRLGIPWPVPDPILSQRDRLWPWLDTP